MIITYYGHSLFTMELANGFVLATDPYNDQVGYPLPCIKADMVTVSHEHFDHNYTRLFSGDPLVMRGLHAFAPMDGVVVRGYASFHDEVQGKMRGENTMFLIEAEGLRILHLGDLGHMLSDAEVASFGHLDVVLCPVGGFYTIDALHAAALCKQLNPRIIVPMHYKTRYSAQMPIAPVDDFIAAMGTSPSRQPLLRITEKDVSEAPRFVVLDVKA